MQQLHPWALAPRHLRRSVPAIALLILAMLSACQAAPPATPAPGAVQPAPPPPQTPAPQPLRLALLHTNDTWGYLWPSG